MVQHVLINWKEIYQCAIIERVCAAPLVWFWFAFVGLKLAPPPPQWMHLVTGTGDSPSPGQPTPGVVKQDQSSGVSVDTTKTRSDPRRVRMSSGERPIGAAKGKQSDTEALCHPPPPRPLAV